MKLKIYIASAFVWLCACDACTENSAAPAEEAEVEPTPDEEPEADETEAVPSEEDEE